MIENIIVRIVGVTTRHPVYCLLFLLFICLASVWQLRLLSFDSSAETLLSPDDPKRLEYLDFEEKYGLSGYFIVLVRDDNLFNHDKMQKLTQLHQALTTQVEYIDGVESLFNARSISSEGDDLLIDTFFAEPLDTSDAYWQKKKTQALNTPYYVNRLVNEQANATGLIVLLDVYDAQGKRVNIARVGKVYQQIQTVVAQYQGVFAEPILIGGSPAVSVELTQTTQREMLLFVLIACVVVAIALYLIFRRIAAVIFPLFCLLATVLMVLASMAFFGFYVQVSSVILPSFLMAVGVADAVHFLRAYYPVYDRTGDTLQALDEALKHTSVAMFYTTLTTSVGLLSFINSNIASIANFGLFSALGVWVALFITLLGLPAVLVLLPAKQKPIHIKNNEQLFKLTQYYVRFLYHYKKAILMVSALVLCVSLALVSQLSFSMNVMEWFKESNSVRQTNMQIEQSLSGTMQVELLISSKEAKPITLAQLQKIDQWLESVYQAPPLHIVISSRMSVLDLLKEANRVLQPETGYQLPQTQALYAQILLLLSFDAQATLASVSNSDMSELRISLSIPWIDSLQYDQFIAQLEQSFQQVNIPQLRMHSTGMATLSNVAFKDLIHSMLISYVYAGLVILVIMMLLSRSIRLGFWVMLLPNITPVVVVLALMYVFDIPLDMFTILIGSIAIGLIVDDTIHLLHTFKRFNEKMGDSISAMTQSLFTTGKALAVTSLVLAVGFASYGLSSLNNLIAFGYLTALCIMLALVADLLILPALLLYLNNKKVL